MQAAVAMKSNTVMNRKPQGNRRIMRARGFRRAWLIADHLKRFDDGAGIILKDALMQMWLTAQKRWV